MNRKFFIASTGEPDKGYESENYDRCLNEKAHILHSTTKQKGAWDEVQPHDVIILKHNNNLVAYGEVIKAEPNSKDLTDRHEEWNWGIFVEKWFMAKNGSVSSYGVGFSTISGGQYGAVKEINKEFAIDKMKAIHSNNTLLSLLNMESQLKGYLVLLENNHNIILTGAPGTGKTYLARKIANFTVSRNTDSSNLTIDTISIKDQLYVGLEITSSKGRTKYKIESILDDSVTLSGDNSQSYNVSINDIIRAYRARLWEGGQKNGLDPYRAALAKYIFENTKNPPPINEIAQNEQIGFVQFHPSYDYTDFVEGLRAVKNDNEVTFTLRNGIFKEFCKKAIQQPNKKFVFIIDEINRGEISKIFGELFFSIDPGYRINQSQKHEKIHVKTQYANLQSDDTIFDTELGAGYFYVPNNLNSPPIQTMSHLEQQLKSLYN